MNEETKSSVELTSLKINLDKGLSVEIEDIHVTRVPGDGNGLYHALALAANECGIPPPVGADLEQGWTHLAMRVLLTTYMNRCLESETWKTKLALTYEELDEQVRPLYDRDTTMEGYGELRNTIAFACYFGLTVYVLCDNVPIVVLKNCLRSGTELTCDAPKSQNQVDESVFIKFHDVGNGHYDYISKSDELQADRLDTLTKMVHAIGK
ncbi:hypothetical protein CYMTET_49921 [Cymbomonas tetramitiformis]|uniref:OTU domain-containing protein n=1 Tax=Cymbomonas tetramitiformis TaxID=36881 RepID=A0AAE0EU83_9CHLO|nr:hypothetical protein CYMTET_49921 [Cymbomonas tetramitiformis]|eukprot:gene6956-8297_t